MLTELEGAILSDILYRGRDTAFRVRRAFADSPSLEWKGSAGAVYSAIQRLERNGLVLAIPIGDARSTKRLSVTDHGRTALLEWACDPTRSASVGADPFRLRAGIWLMLPPDQRLEVIARIKVEVAASITALTVYSRLNDAIERASVDLSLRLQHARLEWLSALAEETAG
ncbi:hypothetical protein MOK15_18350 [Sphingobium sp. BYY-5]|uniref:PadR family transcriptional regulator n=1 Tax=Sphingobium sp. BYY-5 TaxID=2926400 RepID=UPI001FA6F02A|nr:hypothetical protein [Sphingobium sp. BYY-5]MCI4592052.1 hypothetical protein [Sphingobium sp. BYY-5]